MMSLVVVVVLAMASCHVIAGTTNSTTRIGKCEEERKSLDDCVKQAAPILDQVSVMGIPSSPDEVNVSCRAFNTGMSCFDVFSKTCPDLTLKRIMDDQTTGARNLFKFLCDDPQFQKKYFKHIPCYKSISSDWDTCARRFVDLVKDEMSRSNSSDHSRRVELCCSQFGFVRCVYSSALRKCRKEDASFLEQVAETLSNNRAHTPLCRHFETRVCSGSVGSRYFASLALVLLISLSLVSW